MWTPKDDEDAIEWWNAWLLTFASHPWKKQLKFCLFSDPSDFWGVERCDTCSFYVLPLLTGCRGNVKRVKKDAVSLSSYFHIHMLPDVPSAEEWIILHRRRSSDVGEKRGCRLCSRRVFYITPRHAFIIVPLVIILMIIVGVVGKNEFYVWDSHWTIRRRPLMVMVNQISKRFRNFEQWPKTFCNPLAFKLYPQSL